MFPFIHIYATEFKNALTLCAITILYIAWLCGLHMMYERERVDYTEMTLPPTQPCEAENVPWMIITTLSSTTPIQGECYYILACSSTLMDSSLSCNHSHCIPKCLHRQQEPPPSAPGQKRGLIRINTSV